MGELTNLGVYLPFLRLDRAVAAAALRWSGLGGARAGRRAVAGWDEDAVTLALEASRLAMAGTAPPGEVVFASTSAPFHDRQHAGLLVEALGLDPFCRSQDVSGSRRCAVSALAAALTAPGAAPVLIAAGEKRPTQAGSAQQVAFGDGGAAALVGPKGFARLRASASLAHGLVDFYASREHPAPYASEERFVRDMAVESVLLPTLRRLLESAGVTAADIAHVVCPEPASGTYRALAAKLGLKAANAAEAVQVAAGDLGAAHPLFALALALESARPGDLVLLVGFGNGCDALILDITAPPPATGAGAALAHGLALKDYTRFLSLAGCLDLDWGPRAELSQKVTGPVLERHGRDMHGFIGGRDSTGNVQFPKTRMPVSPDADPDVPLDDVRLADVPAKIQSLTADRLNYSPDPPFNFGLVQFENGARVLMEFCDAPPRALEVGAPLAMRFRIKSLDRQRGFRSYFWKACPALRPRLEE